MSSQNNNLNEALNEALEKDSVSTDVATKKPVKKNKKYIKILKGIAFFIGIIIILIMIAFTAMYYYGKSSFFKGDDEDMSLPSNENVSAEVDGKTVIYNGKTYKFNENVTSILCMGVDKDELGTEFKMVGTGGQADAVFLVAIDTANADYTIINISRDALVDVNIYSKSGNYIGVEKTQLCLAYAYGDGRKLSCENTITSVRRLFYGIPINTYLSVDVKAIGTLVDKIGGLQVPEYNANGEKTGRIITLNKNNAEKYIRYRNTGLLDSNNVRMDKHVNFLKAYSQKGIELTKKNINTPLTLYNSVSKYMYSTVSASKITFLTTNALSNKKGINIDFKAVKGTVKEGKDGFSEFIVDNDELLSLIIDVFYTLQE